jgi:hypothetical protein
VAKQLTVMAEVLIQSYDNINQKIVPFSCLKPKTKEIIVAAIVMHLNQLQAMSDKQAIAWYKLNKEKKKKAKQDLLDHVLETCYRLIFEGRGPHPPAPPAQAPAQALQLGLNMNSTNSHLFISDKDVA